MSIVQKVSLTCCEGGSDKEYHMQLVDNGNGSHTVNVQWGRRGSTLQTGTKVDGVDLEKAKKTFTKILTEKVGKGYKQNDMSTSDSYTTTSPEVLKVVVPEMIPQLLNVLEMDEIEKYLRNDAYGMQEKKDGKHQMLKITLKETKAYNKKGIEIACPTKWTTYPDPALLDGEAIGDCFHVFDCLEMNGKDYRKQTYARRQALLRDYGSFIKVVPLAIGYKAKKKLFDLLLSQGKEGVVFKRLDSSHTPGKAHADMFKVKFYSTASVKVVQGRDGKHSIGLAVLDGNIWTNVGNCTIPQKDPLPGLGSIVEIRYLYFYKNGSLFQPTYLGPRDDTDAAECVISQLKLKADEE